MKKYHAGKFGTKQILVLAVALVILLSMGVGPFVHASTSGATLTTDKQDYSPTQTVYITGNGFTPSPNVVITVQRPDLSVQSCVLSSTPGFLDPCPTTSSFTVRYQLDGILGTYVVTATTVTDNVQTSFTDSNAALDQCRNGPVSAPAPCNNGLNKGSYENGDATKSQAHWQEGNFMPYRVTVSGVAAGTHTLVFSYDTVHGGKHAIDYLGSFDATETTSATPTSFRANNNNPCIDVLLGAQAAQCTPASPVNTLPVLPASLVNCATSSGGPPASQVPGSFKIWGPAGTTLNGMTYVSQNVVSGTGQCSTTVSLSFTIGGTGSPTVVIAWGGHIASQADWGFGNSASAISGSPYHMSLNTLDGAPQGSQDRALEAAAIFFTPSITTTIKDSNGNPVTSVTVGTVVHDTATLAGSSSNAGGSVTYNLWNTGTCGMGGGSKLSVQTVTVTNAVVPDSSTFTAMPAGSYSYNATYSGDMPSGQNFGATSACEPLTVTSQTPTLTTAVVREDTGASLPISPVPSILLGTSVHDTATISGGFNPIVGSVTYHFLGSLTCDPTSEITSLNSNTWPQTVTVSAGLVPNSQSTGPLAAGDYGFKAHFTPGNANNNPTDSVCEPFHVNHADTTTSTVVVTDATPSVSLPLSPTPSIALGTSVHDTATVGPQVNGFVIGGSVTYHFFASTTCAPTSEITSLNAKTWPQSQTVSAGLVPNSQSTGPLAAGDYGFQAVYSGDGNYNTSTSVCEPFHVNQANTSTVTHVFVVGTTSPDIQGTTQPVGTSVYDTAVVTSSPTVPSIPITGTVTYNFYHTIDCSGMTFPPTGTQSLGSPSGPTPSLGFGSYSFNATYNGDPNYNKSPASACEPFKISPLSAVTDTSFCPIPTTGFNLIYIQDIAAANQFTLKASNPGQFYYNIFFTGTPGDPVTLHITIPYPFVTQGAVPIQSHDSFTMSGNCFVPGPFTPLHATGEGFTMPTTPSGFQSIVLSNYGGSAPYYGPTSGGVASLTFDVSGTVPGSGLFYVTVHLDYGLKGMSFLKGALSAATGCSDAKGGNFDANSTSIPSQVIVSYCKPYAFSVIDTIFSDTQTVKSINTFKKDPGIAGLVQASDGTPLSGVTVLIYDPSGTIVATLITDNSGFYGWVYEYSGKPVTYTVSIPQYNISTTLTLSSNALVLVYFQQLQNGTWTTTVQGKHN